MTEYINNALGDEYYQSYDKDKQYQQLLFRAGKGLQSRELNDLQLQVSQQVKGLGDVLLKNGSVVSGGAIAVDASKKRVQLGDAQVYLNGAVQTIAAAQLPISLSGKESVGVWLTHTVVTELTDPDMLDPAGKDSPVIAQNFNEPGAARLKVTGHWGKSDTPSELNNAEQSEFYAVYHIDDGHVLQNSGTSKQDPVTLALARYDRESNGGSYVIEGLALRYLKTHSVGEVAKQYFSVQEGIAHINGYEVAFDTAVSAAFDIVPQEREISNEPTNFVPNEQGKMDIAFDFFPVKRLEQVVVTAKKTVQMTRGSEQGGKDLLPDLSVKRIVTVTQGDTVYSQGISFTFTGNDISWQLGGEEPVVGSTYFIEYEYNVDIPHSALVNSETHYTVTQQLPDGGQVIPATEIRVDYTYFMPRIDLIVINARGEVTCIQGASAIRNPVKPQVPEQHLPLAFVHQRWGNTVPRIELAAIQAVNMADMHYMQSQISDLYHLLAIERLRNDTNIQDATSKYGVFVDPFLDDDLRDAGRVQSAAIIDGELLLPIDVEVDALNQTSEAKLLPYELEDILVQTSQTGSMKVNPYQAFEPVPARVTLTPSVDHWTQTQQVWSSPITRRFTQGGGRIQRITSRVTVERVGTQIQQVEFLRPRSVAFTLKGFGPNEQLESVTFDGVTVTAEATS